MSFLKKRKAKLEDLNRFLKENKSKIGGFPPIRGRMESMHITVKLLMCVPIVTLRDGGKVPYFLP